MMFLIYIYTIFAFVDTALDHPRLRKVFRVPVGIFNVAISYLLVIFDKSSSFYSYILVFVLLFVEFKVFYRDTVKGTFCIVSAIIIHIMAIRAICVSVFAQATGNSIYQVANDSYSLFLTTGISLLLLILSTITVMKTIPPEKIRIIIQRDEQLWFITAWLTVFNFYMLFNSVVFSTNESYRWLNLNQIVTSLTILIGFYAILFFSIKITELLGYKEKSKELEISFHTEQQFRNAITHDAIAQYEVNLTKDEIISGLEIPDDELKEKMGESLKSYKQMLAETSHLFVFSEDVEDFMEYADPENMLQRFNNGNKEITLEYRRLMGGDSYIWVRAITTLVKDTITGEIRGFTYIKNIDEEKREQLEIQRRAERDALTGLYNKQMTETLISQWLRKHRMGTKAGTLFIIDVDNFKSINDNLGHSFGDVVLVELGNQLKKVFREDDIVGRIGGDEFMAFMKNSEFATIKVKAEELCRRFRNTYEGKTEKYTVSASVGIAIASENGSTFEELYEKSDIALYSSKNKGKNTYTFYEGQYFEAYKSSRTEIET